MLVYCPFSSHRSADNPRQCLKGQVVGLACIGVPLQATNPPPAPNPPHAVIVRWVDVPARLEHLRLEKWLDAREDIASVLLPSLLQELVDIVAEYAMDKADLKSEEHVPLEEIELVMPMSH